MFSKNASDEYCKIKTDVVSLRIISNMGLTLPMQRLNFHQNHKDAEIFENHPNPVMLVFIG